MSREHEIQNVMELSRMLQEEMQGHFPTFIYGTRSFVENSDNPNVNASKNNSLHVLNGSLVVFLFSMWDSYMGKDAVEKYFRPEEKMKFYAFKHIRIVSAHNINGNRKGNRRDQERMDHAEKLDQIMNSDDAFEGLVLEPYKIDMSNSNVALDCRQFMQDMAQRLASGRISVGAPNGQIRVAGGGTIEGM